ncbi:hypothetical protein E4U31_004208 [Claviceps sp. LM219 group G6]|nr:hypothetical protein E4U31_004208 [Claviceps sp. LM219 group G6]
MSLSSRFMEEYLTKTSSQQSQASSSQMTTSDLSSCRVLSSPPPPTASEKGKAKAKAIKGDVYDAYLAPQHINRSGVKDRVPNNVSLFTYQGEIYVRHKVVSSIAYVGKRSPIWLYGEAVHKESESGSALSWYCYYCERDNRPQSFRLADGGGCVRHLKTAHGYNEETKSFPEKRSLDQISQAGGADASTASANRLIHPKDRLSDMSCSGRH